MMESPRSSYFRRPRLITRMISLFLTLLLFISWYNPEWLLMGYFGVFGRFLHKLGSEHNTLIGLINLGLWIIHGFECVYSIHLCQMKNIDNPETIAKWAVQTFIFGVFSLRLLRNYQQMAKQL